MSFPVFPQVCQPLLLYAFLIIVIVVGIEWYAIMVLICISLIANDVEHPFLSLLTACASPLVKWLFNSFTLYWIICLIKVE